MSKSFRTIDIAGNIRYYNSKKVLHREDGPAVIANEGMEIWYKNGVVHRETGPAIVTTFGQLSWVKDNKRHRENGPAIVYADGATETYKNGLIYQSLLREK